jgi:hypothetical protein
MTVVVSSSMPNQPQLSKADNGKRIGNSRDEQVGRVVELTEDVVSVDHVPNRVVFGDGEPEANQDGESDDRRFSIK